MWLVSFTSLVHFGVLLVRELGRNDGVESSIAIRTMRPRSNIERRRNPRIATPQGLSASWRSGEANMVSEVGDFSVSGAFINTQDAVPVGTRLSVLFSLPEGEIQVQAIVRSSRPWGGMGVEFVSMGGREFDLVLKTFRRLLEQTSPALLVSKS